MRTLNDFDCYQIAGELMAEIARTMTDRASKPSIASYRHHELWGALHENAFGAVCAMETYHEEAVAGELACAFAELATAIQNVYQTTPDFYDLNQWLWNRVDNARQTEEAR